MKSAIGKTVLVAATLAFVVPASAQVMGNAQGMLMHEVEFGLNDNGIRNGDLTRVSLSDLAMIKAILEADENRQMTSHRVNTILSR